LKDNLNGNPYFWNIENDAPGNGLPIPDVQYQAIVTAAAVTARYWNLTTTQIISHAEWTARKIDPYWNNTTRAAAQIRSDLEDQMTPDEYRAIVREELLAQLEIALRTDYTGSTYQHSKVVSNSTWRTEVGGVNREYLSQVLVSSRNWAKLAAEQSDANLEAIAKAVNDEMDVRQRIRLAL
jgi:hypothetical protein